MRKVWSLLLLSFFAVAGAFFAPATSASAAENYTITTDASYPPFDFQGSNQQYTGIDQELLKEIAKREGFTYTLKPMSFDAAAQSVASNQADGIIAGMTITDERLKTYDFSTPYFKTGIVFAVKSGSSIKSLADLKGQTVALKTGTAGAEYALSLQKKYGFKVKYFNDSDIMYNDVVNGNAAATFEDQPVMAYAIKNGLKLSIPKQELGNAGYYGFGVKKGANATLLKQFNAGLAELKKDGTYAKIVAKFLGNGTVATYKPNYTITTDASYPPFDFQDKNNKYTGIDLELLKAIAKREGFTYTLKPMAFNAAAQSVASSQADGIIAGMSITDEREKVYDFGTPYYQTGVVWVVKKGSDIKSLSDLKGKTVALKTGTAGADYAKSLESKYGFKIKYFNDSDTMYNDVVNGNSAAAFEDKPVIAYAIKNGLGLEIPKQELGNAGWYGFAVKKGDNAALLDAFNEGLAALKNDGTYDKIVNEFLGTSQDKYTGSKSDNDSVWGILNANGGAFWQGLLETLKLTALAIVLASVWGIILGLMGVAQSKFLRGLSTTIIYTFRGLPLMVLAFFIYIGIPSVSGLKIPAFMAGLITLILNEGAYTGAFVRGGFEAVEKGQMEAARSLGLSYGKSMSKVIMPQGLRIMIPSFINQFIITLKDTSILSAIGILELTQTGTLIVARTSQGFRVWAIIAVVYLVVITLLTWLSNWAQKKTRG